jgi:hypothetical protein
MQTRPRHANKEVRQLAEWLDDHGWVFTDVDTKGHTIWTWPRNGQVIKLPETPRGTLWLKNTRITALKAMGQHDTTQKRRPKDYVARKPHAGLVITKAHERQLVEWVDECARELCDAAHRNGNDQAAVLFRLFATRLKQIINA